MRTFCSFQKFINMYYKMHIERYHNNIYIKSKSLLVGDENKSEKEFLLKSFRFERSFYSIPHNKKKLSGSEDSFTISDKLLVIADGVGGWRNHKIDPKLYSLELCDNINKLFSRYEISLNIREKIQKINYHSEFCYYDEYNEIYSEKIAKKLLIQSAKLTTSKGSSTCTILMLDKNTGKLFTSYIGDSLFLIARKNFDKYEILFKSKEQMHGFHIPYQVGQECDDPKEAITNTFDLQINDLIILATDGLWDNLDDIMIVDLINKYYKTDDLAKILAYEAYEKSNDKNYFSPFARKAQENKKYYLGGKPDDITIIVALVNKCNDKCFNSENTSTTDNEKQDDF